MNRVDIVRQQRNVPLLNELLFSVLDAKPSDPLAFLIDTLQRISDDVAEYRSKLLDLRKNRTVLREALVRASRKRKPPCTTLLLHAARGLSHCPLLHDMYDAIPDSWEAPVAVVGASGDDGNYFGGDRAGAVPLATPSTKLMPIESRPGVKPPDAATGGHRTSNTNDDEVEVQWGRRVHDSLQTMLRSDASSRAASAKLMPTMRALAAVVHSARSSYRSGNQTCAPRFDGIEVLLVAALESTQVPVRGEKALQGAGGKVETNEGATGGEVVQIDRGGTWHGLTVLLEVLQSHGGTEEFPSLAVLDEALRCVMLATSSPAAEVTRDAGAAVSGNTATEASSDRVSSEAPQDVPSPRHDVFAVLAAALVGEEASCPLLHALLHLSPPSDTDPQTEASTQTKTLGPVALPLLTMLAYTAGGSTNLPNLTLLLPTSAS